MANRQVTIGNADRTNNNAFKVPGDEPNETPFQLDTHETHHYRWYVHVENGWDVNVDVTVEGSHSQDAAGSNTLDAPVTDGDAVTISSGTNDAFTGESGHSQLQLNVNPAGTPSSGDLTVTFQRRK